LGALGLVYLNGRSDFRLKVSVVDGREEWRRKIGDFVCCFLRKGEDPGRGYPKLVTAVGGVRHRGVDPSTEVQR
jgi:DNA helicase HerA-like ATPase